MTTTPHRPGGVPASRPASQHPRQRGPGPVKGLVRPGAGLAAVVVFQLLFASVFLGVLHRPVPHHAPVAVAGASRWPASSPGTAGG